MADYQRLLTIQDAVNRVLGKFGLPSSASVFDSTDGNVIQLLSLANDVGQDLIAVTEWQVLRRLYTVTTDPLATTYALPADFDRFIPDSQWNTTTQLPMAGSVNTQVWQQLKARSQAGNTVSIVFRTDNDLLELYASPSVSETLELPYVSRSWVKSATATYMDNVQANSDVIMYGSEIFRSALALAWMTSKGLDTTAAEQKYREQLINAKNKDRPASTTSISPGGQMPLIGSMNLPVTGYGAI